MDPVLSHISALEYWRSVRIGSRSFRALEDTSALLDEAPNKGALAEPGPWWLHRPLHVLVGKSSARRSSSEVIAHVQSGPLPAGSVLDTRNGFCVCSPELCFLQMATGMTLPKLIELGFELCGTYDVSNGEMRPCMPLTTVEKLAAFAERAERIRGRANALRALSYVASGSASPRETILTMLLNLPYALGGYGIAMPVLNHRIDLGKRERRIAGRAYLVCDLYWPAAKLDVEYDGGLHVEADRVSKDSMRRDALVSMGITVLTVTNWQLNDGSEMNGIAHVIAGRVGKQLRYKDPKFTQTNRALRKELLGNP